MLSIPKLKILIVNGYYLPGYKAGGPIKTIANLVAQLGDIFEFYIVTSNHDLGERVTYSGITSDTWQPVGKAKVMYLSPEQMKLLPWQRLLNQIAYDQIYLNSFFSFQTRNTLILRFLGRIPNCRIILAPRGEFSSGALALKPFKKHIYTKITSRLGFYDNLVWHSTSDIERVDIIAFASNFVADLPERIVLAPNLVSSVLLPELSSNKQSGYLRIVFLSRLSRKKNLHFALSVLRDLDNQSIIFDIYGPTEELKYWEECQQIIQTLPTNIQVTYHGSITPDQVIQTLANYHLFFLPTRGENFGHVIVEAWSAGCLVLISDQTPWQNLEQKGIGWDISLNQPEHFQQILRQIAAMDQGEFSVLSKRAAQFALNIEEEQKQTSLRDYYQLFGITTNS